MPDVASHLEKVDEASLRPLSPEAYSRFRKGLGRLLWLSQTRADVKAWLSLIGSQQSKPTQGTEAALKAVLRFLFGDGDVILELPSTSELLVELGSDGNVRPAFLQVFTDASHAPYRFNNRKGVSGQAIFFKRSLIRSVSKQQQATALSSCEAELYGLQQATQDATAMSRVVHRVLWGIGDVSEFDEPLIQVESDSSSALQLVQGLDLPRRSRHIEIRLMWLRSQVSEGHVVLKHHPGVTNIADIFTKCLGTQLFERHRLALGFRHRDFPTVDPVLSLDEEELFLVEELQVGGIAPVEVCCEPESSLSVESLRRGHRYIGVVKDVQSDELFSEVRKRVREFRQAGLWVHVHVSTPCSSGSPLKNFSQDDTPTIADLEWESIIGSVGRFLQLGKSKSFELPFYNKIWSRPQVVELLQSHQLSHGCQVFLCQMGVITDSGLPVGKSLGIATTHFSFARSLHRRFGTCRCEAHASISEINFTETAKYPAVLAKAMLNAVQVASRDP